MKIDYFYKILVVFGTILLASCQKDFMNFCDEHSPAYKALEADFTTEVRGLEIIFTNKSANAENYLWDFGDGKTSTETNPKHIYSSVGKFKVKLTAIRCGGERTLAKEIEISTLCPAIADFSFEYLSNRSIKFTNKSQNATAFQWDFGDGSPINANQSPTYVFPVGKNIFTVKLTATGVCSSSIEKSISVASGVYWLNLTKIGNEEIRDIKIKNEDIYFTGGSNNTMTIGKLDHVGLPNTTFVSNKMGVLMLNSSDIGQALEIDKQGRIIVLGNPSGANASTGSSIWRVLVSGNQDYGFSFGTLLYSTGTYFYGRDILLQSDDKIVVNGRLTEDSAGWIYYGMARLQTNGKIDASFATNGWFTTTKTANEYKRYSGYFAGKMLANNDNILAAGMSLNYAVHQFTSQSKTPTNSWSSFILPTPNSLVPSPTEAVGLLKDGKVVTIGRYNNLIFTKIAATGQKELSSEFSLSLDDTIHDLSVFGDKIYCVGETKMGKTKDITLIRLTTEGQLDKTFQGKGYTVYQDDNGDDMGYSILIQTDGKILLCGKVLNSQGLYDGVILRYNEDGTLDNSFGQ